MATNAQPVAPNTNDAALPVPPASPTHEYEWDYCTGALLMEDYLTEHFAIAVKDNQAIHFSDEAARSCGLGTQLKGRIMHLSLVRDLAINYLLFTTIAHRLGIESTHRALDQGGCYSKPRVPVYPGDFIYVQFNLIRKEVRHVGPYPVRPKGTFPIEVQYAVMVIRDDEPLEVFHGTHEAQAAYIRPRG